MNQFFIELYKLEKNSWDEFLEAFRFLVFLFI